MKKICNTIKLIAGAVAIWQTIASYYKDEKFKNNLEQAKGFDKVKVMFNNLIDLNKKFFTEVKEVDYKWYYNEYKDILVQKTDLVKEKIENIKEQAQQIRDDKVLPILEDLQQKAENIKSQIEDKVVDIKEKAKLEEKLEQIKEKAEQVKNEVLKKYDDVKDKFNK